MKIVTERLMIRLSTDDEMRGLIADAADPELKKAYSEMLGLSLKFPDKRRWFAVWFIEDGGGNMLGDLCFKGLSDDGTVEIGYGILPEYEGKGFMTEAVKGAVEWAFSDPAVKCVTAETEEDNKASQRVLIKNGFTATGKYGEEGPLFIKYRG